MKHVWDYLPEFVAALRAQLEKDELFWKDTWLQRPREGQEYRTYDNYRRKFTAFATKGVPVPWLQIAGDALICWIRENHPDQFVDGALRPMNHVFPKSPKTGGIPAGSKDSPKWSAEDVKK